MNYDEWMRVLLLLLRTTLNEMKLYSSMMLHLRTQHATDWFIYGDSELSENGERLFKIYNFTNKIQIKSK